MSKSVRWMALTIGLSAVLSACFTVPSTDPFPNPDGEGTPTTTTTTIVPPDLPEDDTMLVTTVVVRDYETGEELLRQSFDDAEGATEDCPDLNNDGTCDIYRTLGSGSGGSSNSGSGCVTVWVTRERWKYGYVGPVKVKLWRWYSLVQKKSWCHKAGKTTIIGSTLGHDAWLGNFHCDPVICVVGLWNERYWNKSWYSWRSGYKYSGHVSRITWPIEYRVPLRGAMSWASPWVQIRAHADGTFTFGTGG